VSIEIKKVYKQFIPQTRFIGKKYGDSDRIDGGFGFAWQQWLEQNWFDDIIKAAGGQDIVNNLYEDGDACLGLMRYKEGEPFEYWIGLFTPTNTTVPDSFEFIDFEQSYCGISWYYGQEPEIYGKEELAMNKLEENGMSMIADKQGAYWFFERYSPSRFHQKDEHSCVTLDIGFFVQ